MKSTSIVIKVIHMHIFMYKCEGICILYVPCILLCMYGLMQALGVNLLDCLALETTVQDNCTHGTLRLVNETQNVSVSSAGRLELCLNRAWGTACGVQFGYSEAEVACRQLEGFYAEGSSIHVYHPCTIHSRIIYFLCEKL